MAPPKFITTTYKIFNEPLMGDYYITIVSVILLKSLLFLIFLMPTIICSLIFGHNNILTVVLFGMSLNLICTFFMHAKHDNFLERDELGRLFTNRLS